MYLKKITQPLTDGSEVFDVQLLDDGQRIVLHAVSERDADALIDLLRTAITQHAVDDLDVWEG